VAGEGIVAASVTLVKVTRGGKKPLFVELTSNFADVCGVLVPIPVWALVITTNKAQKRSVYVFIVLKLES
jgi:hypothetical protein